MDGFRYVTTQPVVLGFMLVDVNAMIFGMPMALFPAIATHRFTATRAVGYLYAAPYAGALVSSLALGLDAARAPAGARRRARGVGVGDRDRGVRLLARRSGRALLLLAVAGAADNISAVFRSTIMLSATPESMRGRLTGIEFAQVASAPTLGNVEAGVVASLTSLRFSIVSGGVACVLGTFVVAAAFPALLRYDAKRDKLT